jgi:prepilin signal peptidase PulO-like enzyme (type II secretory pathway)
VCAGIRIMLLGYIILFVLGLVFGSFVSAVSWRIPKGLSFIKGRSICPKCKSKISWFDNIPLLSFLILGGKCRNCKKKISLRYPLIEIISALGFVLIYKGLSLQGETLQGVYSISQLIFSLLIFLILLTIFVIDLENQIIPDSLTFVGIILVLLYSLFIIQNSLFSILFPGFIAASFLMLIHIATRGLGMGLGDVKFAVLAGSLVGMKFIFVWLFLAFLTGGIAGIILILLGKAKMKTKIAFGPFLIIAIGLTFVLGEKILNYFKYL